MYKCCICGKDIQKATKFVCGPCAHQYELALLEEKWPAWARSELRREKSRRRFRPTYGVSGKDLPYAPYTRRHENQTYRKVNRVRKSCNSTPKRVGAENLFYSTTDGGNLPDTVYEQVLGSLPSDLQLALGRGHDLKVILADAVDSLPLISQRAIRACAMGHAVFEIAQAEGIGEATMEWLLTSARQRLQDILSEKLGADDGMRYRPGSSSSQRSS